MPVEIAIWRVDGGVKRLEPRRLESEPLLRDSLMSDIGLIGFDLLVLGKEVSTDFGTRVDILAIDVEGDLYVIELKRDRTPRDVVAQVLDYASWAVDLTYDEIRSIFSDQNAGKAFEEAFGEKFEVSPPAEVNSQHYLIIVASELDDSTERIARYLSENYGVPINAVFFKFFEEEGRRYLGRSWLIDSSAAAARTPRPGKSEEWNGKDFYVNFGDGPHRSWDDARKYGFVSAGGDPWYTRTLKALFEGARIFVYVPQRGYVGVGAVKGPRQPITEFNVEVEGQQVPLLEVDLTAPQVREYSSDPEKMEYCVPVEWIKTFPIEKAFSVKGLFANQNTVCRLTNKFTIAKLSAFFDLEE
jgi:hypothetical protein